jgi:RNA polymerase sigma factor (sigma-70 family)
VTRAQQKLVEANLALVVRIARKHAKRLPVWIELDEIVAAGNLGLVQAAQRFDRKRGRRFVNWASTRIHGAIMDTFEGPRYPRRYVQMPEEWLTGDADETDSAAAPHAEVSVALHRHELRTPPSLIDRSSPLDALIEREQCVVVSMDAVRARQSLTHEEGTLVDGHICGRSLTEMAAQRRISRGSAHAQLTAAKLKMRRALKAAA